MKTEEQKPENKQCECGSDLVNTTNKDNPFCFHCGKSLTQQETLEEAAERSSELQEATYTIQHKITYKHGFIDGAKWQAENMPIYILDVENTYVHIENGVVIVEKNDKTKKTYTEEEVIELLTQRSKYFGTTLEPFQKLLLKQDLEWFEQFKKK